MPKKNVNENLDAAEKFLKMENLGFDLSFCISLVLRF
jgi:hypothetical protein